MQASNPLTDSDPKPLYDAELTARTYTIPVLALALALRLLVLTIVLTQYPAKWLFTRGIEMGLLAKSLLAGQGLSSPFGAPTGPTAFIAPVYPILIATVFRLFGIETLSSQIVIIATQILISLLTIWLMMRVARQLFGARTANLAGIFWACSLPLVWLPTIFWETSLSIILLTGIFPLALHCIRKPSVGLWICIGAYCGATGLVNPALIPALSAVALWTTYRTYSTVRSASVLALVTACIIFAPWPIRNARIFHAFIPTRTTVGFELWMGNHPGASGYLEEPLFPMYNARELAAYESMGEVAYTSNKTKMAMLSIHQHPAQFYRLTLLRILRFWLGTGTQGGSLLFPLHAITTTSFGAAGLYLLLRRRRFDEAMLFLLPLVVFPLPYYITHAEFRYRVIIDPFLTILSAYGLIQLLQYAKRPTSTRASSTLGPQTCPPRLRLDDDSMYSNDPT